MTFDEDTPYTNTMQISKVFFLFLSYINQSIVILYFFWFSVVMEKNYRRFPPNVSAFLLWIL